MMFNTVYVLLWLLSAIPLKTQGLVKMSITPMVYVTCGESVTLHCNVSSSQDGLVIQHLAWLRYRAPPHLQGTRHSSLCHVNSSGNTVEHPSHTESTLKCNYTKDWLALTMHQILPVEEGTYLCKLRSNQGVKEAFTTVKLQECYREAYINVSSEGVTCTFKGVHPVGEVHWFQGSTNLTRETLTINRAHMELQWLVITSTLLTGELNSQLQEPYNCSLWNPRSGSYITSRLVTTSSVPAGRRVQATNGVGAQVPVWTLLGLFLISAALIRE